MPYVPFPILTDPDAFLQRAFEYLEREIPGWEPAEGNLDVQILAAVSRMSGSLRDLIADVPNTIFMRMGTDLLGIPPKDSAPAWGDVRFTMTNTVGYTIPVGTAIGVRDDSGVSHAFETYTDLVIPAGALEGTIGASAIVPGIAANNLLANYTFLIDAVANVQMVALAQPTSGGADAETDDQYMARVSELLTLMTPAPILAEDYALMSRNVLGVGRAMGLDLYNPATGTWNNERYVTVAVTDASGNPLSAIAMDEIKTYLDSLREINFEVRVIGPTTTVLTIEVEVVNIKGAEPAMVASGVEDAIKRYIDPATWGSPARVGNDPSLTWNWRRETWVRFFEVAAMADSVNGVDWVVSVTINGVDNGDFEMTGVAPLPGSASVVSCEVTPP